MNTKDKLYRFVEAGEPIKSTDIIADIGGFRPVVQSCVGAPCAGLYGELLREVQADPWVLMSEREPTKEDFEANPCGHIHFMWRAGYCETGKRVPGDDCYAWRRCTVPRPPGHAQIKIAGHDVEMLPGGAVKVGRQTIDAATVDEIARRSQEARVSYRPGGAA